MNEKEILKRLDAERWLEALPEALPAALSEAGADPGARGRGKRKPPAGARIPAPAAQRRLSALAFNSRPLGKRPRFRKLAKEIELERRRCARLRRTRVAKLRHAKRLRGFTPPPVAGADASRPLEGREACRRTADSPSDSDSLSECQIHARLAGRSHANRLKAARGPEAAPAPGLNALPANECGAAEGAAEATEAAETAEAMKEEGFRPRPSVRPSDRPLSRPSAPSLPSNPEVYAEALKACHLEKRRGYREFIDEVEGKVMDKDKDEGAAQAPKRPARSRRAGRRGRTKPLAEPLKSPEAHGFPKIRGGVPRLLDYVRWNPERGDLSWIFAPEEEDEEKAPGTGAWVSSESARADPRKAALPAHFKPSNEEGEGREKPEREKAPRDERPTQSESLRDAPERASPAFPLPGLPDEAPDSAEESLRGLPELFGGPDAGPGLSPRKPRQGLAAFFARVSQRLGRLFR